MKTDLIMSHIFKSHYTMRTLEALGSSRRLFLVDNSYSAELKGYAKKHPWVTYLRPKMHPNKPGQRCFSWFPKTCAASWNMAMTAAETEWVINVNPDVDLWPQALDMFEKAIEQRGHDSIRLMRTQINFNVWAGHRATILGDLGGWDDRFVPCGGEDEDMLVRLSQAGFHWSTVHLPVTHVDGGHQNRVDGYCNVSVFNEKHGFKLKGEEYKRIVSEGAR